VLFTCLLQGFKPLMSAHRVHDLARMYSLLSHVGGTHALRDEWKQYITTTGTAIVKDEANVSANWLVLYNQPLWKSGGLRAAFVSISTTWHSCLASTAPISFKSTDSS
jgi:hypothetical protein